MIEISVENGYFIESLSADDLTPVEALCKSCSDYYILHNGLLPQSEHVKEIFLALPPGKSYKDKFVLGIYNSKRCLVGIIDIIMDFPDCGEWMLGLLMIEPEERNNGLGKLAHESLVKWGVSLGAKSFRIGVISDNIKGIKFWSNLGYVKIKEVKIKTELKTHIVNVMTRNVS